jgi:hypothetical protein
MHESEGSADALIESCSPQRLARTFSRPHQGEKIHEILPLLIQQHLTHRLTCSPLVPQVGDHARDVKEQWLSWIAIEAVSFVDATIIEIARDRRISGRASTDSYQKTIGEVRDSYFTLEKRVTEDEALFSASAAYNDTNRWFRTGFMRNERQQDPESGWVPARNVVTRLLLTAAPHARTTLLWNLLTDWRSIIQAIQDLLDHFDDAHAWVLSLGYQANNIRIVDAFRKGPPGSYPDWFFDPNRLRAINHAARTILRASNSPPTVASAVSAMARPVDVIEDALRVFLSGCKAAQKRLPPEFRNSPPVYNEIQCEQAFWQSFEDDVDVLTACRGHAYTEWLLSTRLENRRTISPTTAASPSVTIFGAGVAGLTAAHELAERGFKVYVLESSEPPPRGEKPDARYDEDDVHIGGVAKTQWGSRAEPPDDSPGQILPPGVPDRARYPGEHGYRLFPSFYRHVFDTMKRTPMEVARGLRATAFDQLQPTKQQVFARNATFVPLSRDRPRSLEAFRQEYMRLLDGLGFERRDLTRFFLKLVRYLMTCSERRDKDYCGLTFWEFLGGDGYYSKTFTQMLLAAPQALVAMDTKRCDARTQGNVYLQLLIDQVLGSSYTDSTLRGPTSYAWFEPWHAYLRDLGVEFRNAKLMSITQAQSTPPPKNPRERLEFTIQTKRDPHRTVPETDYYVVALDPISAERVTSGWNSAGVPRELRGFGSYVTKEVEGKVNQNVLVLPLSPALSWKEANEELRSLLDFLNPGSDRVETDPVLRSAFRSLSYATGAVLGERPELYDEIQVTLWFERRVGAEELSLLQMALRSRIATNQPNRFTSREPEWIAKPVRVWTPRTGEDTYGVNSGDRFQLFTGIQYYFDQAFQLVRGHVYFPDSEWGLSAVSQSQFWPRESLPDGIRGVLSVDIGDTSRASSYTGKSLRDSSPDEIQREVWRQIGAALQSVRGQTAHVVGLPLPKPRAYHIDDNLLFAAGRVHGNLTPFLINNANDWDNRPRCNPWIPGRARAIPEKKGDSPNVWQADHGGYRIHADCVVFCGHYMRTFTRMTTMEAANESARHAVNAILDHMQATQDKDGDQDRKPVNSDYCEIWDPECYRPRRSVGIGEHRAAWCAAWRAITSWGYV